MRTGRPPRPVAERFWEKVEFAKFDGCWEWLARLTPSGYGEIKIHGKQVRAHRFSWVLSGKGPIPAHMLVCHRCDNRRCVNPDHLFLGTPLDNMRDKVAKGRLVASPGEKNGCAKLSAADVLEIRAAVSGGATQHSQAVKFGISASHVHRLVRRIRWPQI